MIGNSRLHWGMFEGTKLIHDWDTPHLSDEAIATLIRHNLDLNVCPDSLPNHQTLLLDRKHSPELWFASVVPNESQQWERYANAHPVTLDDLPIQNLYPTLGIDRALALVGAAQVKRFPALVIDGGTALTLTGADGDGALVGGAILPGLQLQLRSLHEHTAMLPTVARPAKLQLPDRWATSTPDAIKSGVLHGLVAAVCDYLQAWWSRFPDSIAVLTGGDGYFLTHSIQARYPDRAQQVLCVPHLTLIGIQAIKQTHASG